MQTPLHISAEQLDAFLRGACAPAQANEVELHIDTCADCRQVLSALVRGQRDLGLDTTHQVAASPVTPGDVVSGKYKVERVLGTGGMGTVVSAWHEQLNQRVALKFMLPAIAADSQASARFLREGRAAARLTTPHACRVLDFDSLPNGTPYLVMELFEGETLATRLARAGPLSVPHALHFVRQALAALEEAHALSIVHRDFKPVATGAQRAEGGPGRARDAAAAALRALTWRATPRAPCGSGARAHRALVLSSTPRRARRTASSRRCWADNGRLDPALFLRDMPL